MDTRGYQFASDCHQLVPGPEQKNNGTPFCLTPVYQGRIYYSTHAVLFSILFPTADEVSVLHFLKQWFATILHPCFSSLRISVRLLIVFLAAG